MRYLVFEHPQCLSERARMSLKDCLTGAIDDCVFLVLDDGLKPRAFSREFDLEIVPDEIPDKREGETEESWRERIVQYCKKIKEGAL